MICKSKEEIKAKKELNKKNIEDKKKKIEKNMKEYEEIGKEELINSQLMKKLFLKLIKRKINGSFLRIILSSYL